MIGTPLRAAHGKKSIAAIDDSSCVCASASCVANLFIANTHRILARGGTDALGLLGAVLALAVEFALLVLAAVCKQN